MKFFLICHQHHTVSDAICNNLSVDKPDHILQIEPDNIQISRLLIDYQVRSHLQLIPSNPIHTDSFLDSRRRNRFLYFTSVWMRRGTSKPAGIKSKPVKWWESPKTQRPSVIWGGVSGEKRGKEKNYLSVNSAFSLQLVMIDISKPRNLRSGSSCTCFHKEDEG